MEQREKINGVISVTSRKRFAPAACEPSNNKVPRYDQITVQQSFSSVSNNLDTTSITEQQQQLRFCNHTDFQLFNNNNNNNSQQSTAQQQQPIIIWNTSIVSSPLTSATALLVQPTTDSSNSPLDLNNNNIIITSDTYHHHQQQQPVPSSRASESSQGPLFRATNYELPKYR
ncbi:hypothetical protein BDA99DRAFT_565837 [Phascolomyces articulosus]|uniref:Uncharacterized protein n=1 Tax=Phascolomyces articulosus TaxID=60185 RepID=A0AAD5JXJ1_9FUNG|nr:hypothetical protein BDA99DRAFT_565837 [Phascolomyces articulosus]